MLPTSKMGKWIEFIGDKPDSEAGLYGLACSIERYCGVVSPWGIPFLVFGDDPSDMYWIPKGETGMFVRWVGADSLEQLVQFAKQIRDSNEWDEETQCAVTDIDLTVIDTCATNENREARIKLKLPIGNYIILSRYS